MKKKTIYEKLDDLDNRMFEAQLALLVKRMEATTKVRHSNRQKSKKVI